MRFEARIKKLEARPIPVGLLQNTIDITRDEAERIYQGVMGGSESQYIDTAQGWVNLDDLSVSELKKLYRTCAG